LTGTITLEAGFFTHPLSLVGLFAIMDSSIRTALDQDHFHRNTLQWKLLRKALWPTVLVIAGLNVVLKYGFSYALEAQPIVYGAVGAVLGYAAVTMVVCSVRTPDVSTKRFVLWLGLAAAAIVALLIVAYPIVSGLSDIGSNPPAALSLIFAPIGSYFILRAAMSLSPTGRLEMGRQ
jgi:uncharacterized membrane protein SirB2